MAIYESGHAGVRRKQDASPLTEADLASHHVILEGLANMTPGLPVLSEESDGVSYDERKHWKRYWLVDPLDGTREFINRTGEFTVNIALIEEGFPILGVVHAPIIDRLYCASRGSGACVETAGQSSR
ncbi:MAG: 3'(2'),5'-bisphosphate nucleotidase CysQ, partial [Burkholderiales bacterium]|nr:3'(2'),5'-bisphosphate nucleotidase CysQ [Burkholderiales bacterium]